MNIEIRQEPPDTAPARIRVGEFILRAESNEIEGPAGVVRLRPLIMQVLVRLAATPAMPVTREQLINDVWSRKIVNDEVLSRAIAELRTALADDAKVPRYIETLPKIGYRLVAAVSRSTEAVAPVTDALTPRTPVPTPKAATRANWPVMSAAAIAIVIMAAILLFAWRSAPRQSPADSIAIDAFQQINAATPFASDPALELAPRFSGEGKQVIYARRDLDKSELVIQDVQTGARQVVVASVDIVASPVFFPETGPNARIAFWRRTGTACEIVEHVLATKQQRQLLDCALNPQSRFDLSPDGKRLVFSARASAEYPIRLMLLEIASQQVRALTEPKPGDGGDVQPRFSPDGTRIAFFRGNESHQRVWTMDAATPHTAAPATSVEGLSYGLAWIGPQGPLLVAADWHGFRALNALDLAAGTTRLIGARGARFPDIASDGNIVFESAAYRADLWLTDAAEPGKKREALWPSSRYTNQPEFSPDGKRVVFCSNRENTDGIFVGTIGGEARRLPLPGGFRYIRPHWTPDGRHILAVRMAANANRSGEQQAIKINAATGQHEILAQAGNAVAAVHALGNGDLLIGEVADYAMRIVRIHHTNGEKKRLALPLVGDFAVNAKSLVYTLPQLSGATLCDIDTLNCGPLKIALNDANRFDWTLTQDAIWYVDVDPAAAGKRILHRYDLATGRISRHDFAPSGAGTSLAVSPDGTRLIVMQEAPPAIDLMLARTTLQPQTLR